MVRVGIKVECDSMGLCLKLVSNAIFEVHASDASTLAIFDKS